MRLRKRSRCNLRSASPALFFWGACALTVQASCGVAHELEATEPSASAEECNPEETAKSIETAAYVPMQIVPVEPAGEPLPFKTDRLKCSDILNPLVGKSGSSHAGHASGECNVACYDALMEGRRALLQPLMFFARKQIEQKMPQLAGDPVALKWLSQQLAQFCFDVFVQKPECQLSERCAATTPASQTFFCADISYETYNSEDIVDLANTIPSEYFKPVEKKRKEPVTLTSSFASDQALDGRRAFPQ